MNTWSFGLAWNLHNDLSLPIIPICFRCSKSGPLSVIRETKVLHPIKASRRTISTTASGTNFEQAINLYALGNPDLKWQVTLDRNIGVDVTLLQNRVSFTLDYYDKNTDPVLHPSACLLLSV